MICTFLLEMLLILHRRGNITSTTVWYKLMGSNCKSMELKSSYWL
jgi:hypothetical protein